ncbi:hypothetical protein [Alloyangia pacifica]|uniref:hypothetical protein n=1 Tax=Alloyangia pacifica TaxID=311180 RepID=UPI00131F0F19|nr:hypothetical protein [Alloyangia pacifica]
MKKIPEGLVEDQILKNLIDFNNELGTGTTRRVYGVKGSQDFVIKQSHRPFHYSNFVEWTVWHAVDKMAEDILGNEANLQLLELFARTAAISHSAEFLIMERLQPLKDPDRLQLGGFPDWLNDRKPSAFGLTGDGRVKVMDYAMVNFYQVLNPLNRSGRF